ncbi:MAG TPA: hypothetical protein VFZ25_08955 [Chloroflexota bacterium]|nr:hypothetical protein [Chloroflexota bacterium]
MVYLKACPRCRGDIFTETDRREVYYSCLQCGHVLTVLEERVLQFRTQKWLTSAKPRRREAA